MTLLARQPSTRDHRDTNGLVMGSDSRNMSSEAISLWTETSSDPELIAGVRAGDTAAFGVLYERHVDAARKVAAMYTNTVADIDDVVSESFSRVLRALQRGDGPDLAFRAYLFTIVRRTGMDIINKGIRTKPRDDMGEFESNMGYGASSDEPAIEGFEHGMVADAFRSLPERWQAVLWYTEVEKKSPREIAPLLGLSANGVAALSYRAREALRQAYLQQHLNSADTVSCLEANAQLGAYVRGGLNKREQAQVGSHVETCERCAALVAELEDVNRGMRSIIAPLILGVAGMAALEGGLPIGGAFGPGGGASAGATAGGAGTGASATSAASAAGSVAAGGIAAGSSAAGSATTGTSASVGAATNGSAATGTALGGGASTGGSMAGLMSGVASFGLPAVAVVAIVALAVNAAGALGLIDGAPEAGEGAQVTTSEPKEFEPGGKYGDGPADPIDPPIVAPELPVLPGTTEDPETGDDPDADASDTSNPGTNDPGTGSTAPTKPKPQPDPDPDPTDPPTDPDDPPPPPPPTFALLSIGQAPLDFLEILRNSPVMSMTVANSGEDAAEDVTASITLPEGLEFEAPSGGGAAFAVIQTARIGAYLQFAATGTFDTGPWTCALEEDATVATCTLSDLAAGASATLDLDLVVVTDGDLADDAMTHFAVTHGDAITSYSVRTGLKSAQADLDLRYAASGQVAATQVGAPLMSCDLSQVACTNAMSFAGSASQNTYNNNHWSMIPLNEAGGDSNSSTTNLVLPEGATVLYASLEWSANAGSGDTFDRPLTEARIKAPGESDYVDVVADGPAAVSTDGGGTRQYYQSQVDITELVQQYGAGQWSVADIALSSTRLDPDPSYYGGFALTVIYSHADLPDSRVALFDGTDWVQTGDSTDFAFATNDSADVTVGWVAWEGDRGILGDRVDINDDNLVPMRWNPGGNWPLAATPTGDSGNAADSSAYGSKYANSLGVDAKSFRTMTLGAGTHVLTAGTSTDQYLIGALTVTIAYND
jgi:RNA polymerase sigma factor (sigma-70 family)